jgi:hypothetical protein
MRRKGERPVVHQPISWPEAHTIRRRIESGDRWLYAWIAQQCAGGGKLAKKSGMTQERIDEIFYGAEPTEEELTLLAVPLRTDAITLRASMKFDRSSREEKRR